jgi:hypothetical protein
MSDEIRQQVNKRLALNLLIQGASAHTCLTAHHLVKDELESIRPGLTQLYDKLAVSLRLNYFYGDFFLFYGWPSWFWGRTHRLRHPFHNFTVLARHGGKLARATKRNILTRGWKKWVIGVPIIHLFQMYWLLARVAWAERGHQRQLVQLAKTAITLVWGIEESRIHAEITRNVAFGHLRTPKTIVGRLLREGAVGYSGVERRDDQLMVVAKAWNFTLVIEELLKGVAELVCLHGLNSLDNKMYETVTDEADHIEYEIWMLQAGPEMWRRLLAVLPNDRSVAEMLMHIARLDPEPLERLMLAVVENPAEARDLLEALV